MFYTHLKYMKPEEILKNDDIVIMGVSSTHVWFSVTEPEVTRGDSSMTHNAVLLGGYL